MEIFDATNGYAPLVAAGPRSKKVAPRPPIPVLSGEYQFNGQAMICCTPGTTNGAQPDCPRCRRTERDRETLDDVKPRRMLASARVQRGRLLAFPGDEGARAAAQNTSAGGSLLPALAWGRGAAEVVLTSLPGGGSAHPVVRIVLSYSITGICNIGHCG